MQKINNDLMEYILLKIKDNSRVTEKEIAKEMFYSERTIRRYIKILKDNKKIILFRTGKNRRWKIIE